MKRALMLSIYLLSVTLLAAGQEGMNPSPWRATVKSAATPLYAGLSADSQVVSRLPAGETVAISLEISTTDGRWYRVSLPGQPDHEGYLNGKDLLVEDPQQIALWEFKPPPEPEPAPGDQAAAKPASKGVLVSQGKNLQDVKGFFVSRFGRSLPISAFGQTALHNHLGFDHRNSLDVALHPDSVQGRALISNLRSLGVPFIAFRHAVPGIATGAHIHVGRPSHRKRVRHR
jgi:hypothetical protein